MSEEYKWAEIFTDLKHETTPKIIRVRVKLFDNFYG